MNELQVLSQIISSRRSVFTPMMTGAKIPEEIIIQALENALYAPNHKKTEPWRFYLLKDKALERLSNYSAEYYLNHTSKEKYSERKYKKTRNNAILSSHVIAICMKRDSEERVPVWEEQAAVAMAVQNIWLSISAAGYGCYWSTPKYALGNVDFLNLEQGVESLGLLYIGVPTTGLNLKGERQALETRLTVITE